MDHADGPPPVKQQDDEVEHSVTTTSPTINEAPSTSGKGGYTLQSKPANVTLGRKESLTKKGSETGDELKDTKDFVSFC